MNEIPKISSRDNQRLINARKIRDRHMSGKLFIEGKRLAIEALRSNLNTLECFVSERFAYSGENSELLKLLTAASRFSFELPDRIFHTVSATDHSQGVILIADCPDQSESVIERSIDFTNQVPIVLLLFRINNPSNLGAVLRTAEAAGVSGVIVSQDSADVISPKSLRASMGAAFRLPIWKDADFGAAVSWAKIQGLRVTATGAKSSNDYTSVDWHIPRLLIFGSEAHGLGKNEMVSVEETIRIPMESSVESLNLAVASGIVLFEAKRQRDIIQVNGAH